MFALTRCDQRNCSTDVLKSSFHLHHTGKRVVPPLLKLSSDETVLGLSSLILPFETVGFVACLLECKVKRASLFVGQVLAMIESIECCLDSKWSHRLEDLDGDGLIDSGPREGDARADHLTVAISVTPVARSRTMPLARDVADPKTAPAPAR
ncbi:MAG: hypothetical protein JWQ42_506 [Edaphobacter sp.]|nr:hypothetical protein [Edaphobacter sp.]